MNDPQTGAAVALTETTAQIATALRAHLDACAADSLAWVRFTAQAADVARAQVPRAFAVDTDATRAQRNAQAAGALAELRALVDRGARERERVAATVGALLSVRAGEAAAVAAEVAAARASDERTISELRSEVFQLKTRIGILERTYEPGGLRW